MSLYEENRQKIKELLPNCADRALRWMDQCFLEGKDFRISEAYRPQNRQNELWKVGRMGIDGEKPVTYTKLSKHTLGRAIDVYPVSLPDAQHIRNFNHRGTESQIQERLKAYRLMELQMIGIKYGVYRPPETLSFGDLVHFEIYDVPLPIESPAVVERRENRLKKRRDEADRINRIVAERRASRLEEPVKSRLKLRLTVSPI